MISTNFSGIYHALNQGSQHHQKLITQSNTIPYEQVLHQCDSSTWNSVMTPDKPHFAKKYYVKNVRLPADFTPGPYDVICGRGKSILEHPGNRRYSEIIKAITPQYDATLSKIEKTFIVTSVIRCVEQFASPGGGFVKDIDGVWYKVSDSYAREKIGQSLRDALHTDYKSSSRAKSGRKKYNHFPDSKHLNKNQVSRIDSPSYDVFKESIPWNTTLDGAIFNFRLAADPDTKDSLANDSQTILGTESLTTEDLATQVRLAMGTFQTPLDNTSNETTTAETNVVCNAELDDPEGLDLMVKTLIWDD